MRGVRAVGGDQAAAFVIEKHPENPKRDFHQGSDPPPPHLERRLRLQCEYLLMFLTT